MSKALNPTEYALTVPGWMTNIELGWLAKMAAGLKPGATWLEVGTWMGRSWSAVALSLPERSTIFCVDDFWGKYAEPKEWTEKNGWAFPRFTQTCAEVQEAKKFMAMGVLISDSVQAASQCRNAMFDVIFIDGDHREAGVRADLEAWLPKLKPEGIMCGHDIDDPGVRAGLKGRNYTTAPKERGSIWMLA